MRKILLLFLAMTMSGVAMASADWREKLSVEDVMKVIKAAHPQCAEHPAELRRLSEKALGVTSDNGKETAAAEADRTSVA